MVKDYQCWIRPVKTPDLPEVDFFESLLKEAGEALGLKVFYLEPSKSQTLRHFQIPSTPQAVLPTFDETNIHYAMHLRDKAVRAINKRKAEEDARVASAEAAAKRATKTKRRRTQGTQPQERLLQTIFRQQGWGALPPPPVLPPEELPRKERRVGGFH